MADLCSSVELSQRRVHLPGLYESYIPQGVCDHSRSTSQYLLSYQPVGDLAGRPSVIVVMTKAQNGGILRLIQLMVDEETPFTGNVRDITMSRGYMFTVDDTYDE